MVTTIWATRAASFTLIPPALATFWTDLFYRRIVFAIGRLLSSCRSGWNSCKSPITDRWKEAQLFGFLLSYTGRSTRRLRPKLQYIGGVVRVRWIGTSAS